MSEKRGDIMNEKVDIEYDFDAPVFDILTKCMQKILESIDDIPENELKRGYYVAMRKNMTPEMDDNIFYLEFKMVL